MRQRMKIFVLCVLPIALAFLIRYRYVNSPQHAFRSFITALAKQDRTELQRWTTASVLKIMMSSTAHQPINAKQSTMNGWTNWAQISRSSEQFFYKISEKTISNHSFTEFNTGSIIFVFANVNGQWKLVTYGEPDTLQLYVNQVLWEASEEE